MRRRSVQRIGLISDTHGLLRPEAAAFLSGCSLIVHGGDIGGRGILDALRGIAPVTAVRGNNDPDAGAGALRHREIIRAAGITVLAVHDRATLDVDPRASGICIVMSGHSHKPGIEERDGVLYVNPGSAGPRRFKLPVAAGDLCVDAAGVTARVMDLENTGRVLASARLGIDEIAEIAAARRRRATSS
jgi:putative phosphoesterase